MTETTLMSIPGQIDPVPVAREITPREDGRVDLMGLPRKDIAALFEGAGLDKRQAKLRAKQVYHWLYHRGVTDFEAMTDIAKTMRPWLAERFVIGRPDVVEAQHSTDGTRKWLLKTPDGHEFEMVFIPDADRGTLCVSSQVGCTLNCTFCHTGTMRLVRNLTVGEIVGQVMLARDALGEWPKGKMDFAEVEDEAEYTADGRLLTNIVMMGMGEPLYNFDNVRDALQLVMDGDGLALSKRRITLSTSGVVPAMARCGEEIGVNLAVSLHAVTKNIRDEIVPINRKYGLEELLQACADYPGASNARRITFEYVMLKDKNDSDEHARELVRLLKHYKLPAKVNLIPFNPWPGANYECSTPERIRAFSNIVFEGGISAPVRTPRGRDIDAACGQLKTAAEKKSRAQRDREEAEAASAADA
ncbi:23S rRNA (adenine(2503)-C(2))-methyltransferase RlmN [Aurantiacibacter rhizosphaerae]|uniref:Dual-specificity RNA methyltransferase RlmN n=1 Tax=Aurantiacibacter rhizosphaerae TaxID=2691582 RepID=A0A844XD19_9SPHN|nr:23S rRNA (adenine(2503)-C(2))-methyltransferase RlmN [Aurantiacibacter rhizosphaerae]MWV28347.1 23S rRNA (adenine(2503)-C(2))-methyltransferase RlmN [Aurantiacibacter rhizosphaerae]